MESIFTEINEVYTGEEIRRSGFKDTGNKEFAQYNNLRLFKKGNEMISAEPLGNKRFKVYFKCKIIG